MLCNIICILIFFSAYNAFSTENRENNAQLARRVSIVRELTAGKTASSINLSQFNLLDLNDDLIKYVIRLTDYEELLSLKTSCKKVHHLMTSSEIVKRYRWKAEDWNPSFKTLQYDLGSKGWANQLLHQGIYEITIGSLLTNESSLHLFCKLLEKTTTLQRLYLKSIPYSRDGWKKLTAAIISNQSVIALSLNLDDYKDPPDEIYNLLDPSQRIDTKIILEDIKNILNQRSSIQVLELSDCEITNDYEFLLDFPNLKDLSLKNNAGLIISESFIEKLQKNDTLEKLDLRGVNFDRKTFDRLNNLRNGKKPLSIHSDWDNGLMVRVTADGECLSWN